MTIHTKNHRWNVQICCGCLAKSPIALMQYDHTANPKNLFDGNSLPEKQSKTQPFITVLFCVQWRKEQKKKIIILILMYALRYTRPKAFSRNTTI